MKNRWGVTAGGILLALAGCSDQATAPTQDAVTSSTVAIDNDADIHGGRGGTATVRWNRRAISLFRFRLTQGGPPNALRINSYLALAQYQAALEAVRTQSRWHRQPIASLHGAVAGASYVILRQFYPLDSSAIESEFAAQRGELNGAPWRQANFDRGDSLGRRVAATVLLRAAGDHFGVTPLPTQPVGPGYWVSSPSPIVKGAYGAVPFFLRSADEINAPPPPAFGSPAFLAALGEVRSLALARTPEQIDIVRKWVPFSGVVFNSIAADLIEKHHRGELAAARILAYANLAAFDATIGCFQTKFVYWFIRPTQADPSITLATGLPNHPSYPSAHSCESGAWEEVLIDAFPGERRYLKATAEEASFSRIVGGLHYRFDGNAGLELGRRAGKLALRRGIR